MKPGLHSLASKLFAASALILLITAGSVALIGYQQARQAITAEVERHILGVVLERRVRLETWLNERIRAIREQTVACEFANALHLWITSNGGEKDGPGLERTLNRAVEDSTVVTAILFAPNGYPIAQSGGGFDAQRAVGLPEIRRALRGETSFGSIFLNAERKAVINLVAPVHDSASGETGAYLLQFSVERTIDVIMTDSTGLGQRGEAFLVGGDKVMLTPSRFMKHPEPLTHTMPIPPVEAAIRGGTGSMVYRSFLGWDVVGAYSLLPEQGWAVIAEMDIREAYAPLRRILVNTIFAVLIALVIMLGVTMLLSRTWTRPLEKLAEASEKVGRGDLGVQVSEDGRQDEIGILMRTFNRMMRRLRESRDELQRSSHRLLQAEKLAAVGKLVASIVHEMRNPLSSIKMNIRLLQRATDQSGSEQEHLSLAAGEVERLEMMFSELLDYSKPLELEKRELDAVDLLKKVVRAVGEKARDRGVTLKTDTGGSPVRIYGDPEWLLRALVNLAENAITASGQGDTVILSAEQKPDGGCSLHVIDQGEGMSGRVVEHIFDPFFTTREQGTGLGMSNVRKIVDAHFGTIDVKSATRLGTEIIIRLPHGENDGFNFSD